MGSQQFCLKWNNHQSNLIDVFDELLENETFVDVTLACEGSSLKAHKVVLSACSPFFKTLLRDNPCKHPIIIMKDMKYNNLKSILQFMYKGEVSISQDQLSSLLHAAETLKVKGLAEVHRNQQHHTENSSLNSLDHSYGSPPPIITHSKKKRKRPNEEVQHVEPKSKLESSLLGEINCSNPSRLPNELPINDQDMEKKYSSDMHNISDYSNNNIHHVASEEDPALVTAPHDSPASLSPHHALHHSDHSAQDFSDEVEEIDQKFPVDFHPNVNDDLGSGTTDENDSMLDGSIKLSGDSSQDITAAAIATQVLDINKPEVRRQCHICNKVLKSAQINRHIRAIHMNARFQCQFCPATYNDRSNLKRHMKTAHYGIGVFSLLENNGGKHDNNNDNNDNNNITASPEALLMKSEPDAFPS